MTSRGLNYKGSKRAKPEVSPRNGGPVEEPRFTAEALEYLLQQAANSGKEIRTVAELRAYVSQYSLELLSSPRRYG